MEASDSSAVVEYGGSGAMVEVNSDEEYQKRYFERAIDFWRLIKTDEPPALIDRDWKCLRDANLRLLCEAYEEKLTIDQMQAEAIRSRIFESVKGRARICKRFFLNGFDQSIQIIEKR